MRNETRTLSRRPIFRRHWHLHVDRPSRVYTPRTHALRVHAHACPSTRTVLLLLRDDNNKAGRGMEHGVFIVRWSGARTWFLFFFFFFAVFLVSPHGENHEIRGKGNEMICWAKKLEQRSDVLDYADAKGRDVCWFDERVLFPWFTMIILQPPFLVAVDATATKWSHGTVIGEDGDNLIAGLYISEH